MATDTLDFEMLQISTLSAVNFCVDDSELAGWQEQI